jgi:hypothetical protein
VRAQFHVLSIADSFGEVTLVLLLVDASKFNALVTGIFFALALSWLRDLLFNLNTFIQTDSITAHIIAHTITKLVILVVVVARASEVLDTCTIESDISWSAFAPRHTVWISRFGTSRLLHCHRVTGQVA